MTTRHLYLRLAVAWVLTRALAVLLVHPFGHVIIDVYNYQSWLPALQSGAFPADDTMWQYPPGAGVLLLVPDLGPGYYLVWFQVLMLVFDLGILAMLMTAHARRADRADLGLWLWALAGAICGPLMVTRFDLVPTFFAVAAVLLLARPALSGGVAAVGFLVKVWPGLILLALPRARTWRGAVAFVGTAVVLLAFMSLFFDDTLSFIGNQASRGLQVESTGALLYWLPTLVGTTVDNGLEYGSMQVRMAGAETVGTVLTVLGLAVLAVLAWWRVRGRLEKAPGADVALTAVMVVVATSRVYSPQFNVWLIGLAAVATITTATGLRTVALILVGVSVITQVVYPFFPSQLTDADAWMVLVQAMRIAALVTAVVMGLRSLYSAPRRA